MHQIARSRHPLHMRDTDLSAATATALYDVALPVRESRRDNIRDLGWHTVHPLSQIASVDYRRSVILIEHLLDHHLDHIDNLYLYNVKFSSLTFDFDFL